MRRALGLIAAALLNGCDSGTPAAAPDQAAPPASLPEGCTGFCGADTHRLSSDDVRSIIAQAVSEASTQGQTATIAVVDRVGRVLGLYRMTGAQATVTIDSGRGVSGGLEGLAIVPSELAAISKAITAAYLSSEGNAFSTRTAGQLIQQHFNPGETNQPGGPLFGVQFSQLPCSDVLADDGVSGPQRSPLGLAADPGGLPLYVEGVPVGGLGVEIDGRYGLDRQIFDIDRNVEEVVALAGAFGRAAPLERRAERITLDGRSLRFSDATADTMLSDPAQAAPTSLDALGSFLSLPAYSSGAVRGGHALGQLASGIAPSGDYPGQDAWVLARADGSPRFPVRGGHGPAALDENEVRLLLSEALAVAQQTRSQIRVPRNSPARVNIAVVDAKGAILGLVRSRDAPVFGIDVSVQKARTAAFLSGDRAAAALGALPAVNYPDPEGRPSGATVAPADYVTAARAFLDRPSALGDAAIAFTDRAGGNLARPFYPDGITGTLPGPFAKPIDQWSPFNVGLQSDLVLNALASHLLFVLGAIDTDARGNCTGIEALANGLQTFPGSVPIYRGSTLVGGIGVSGDGVDQDDMIAFLGVHRSGATLGSLGNAPPGMRADQLSPQGTRLRYVQCPQAPFLNSDEQDVCDGL